jgi:hypothetical protein
VANYSIKKTDWRARTWEHLEDATGEGNTSAALDVAAEFYLRMAGDTGAYPTGAFDELLAAAEERGSLTGEEIVEILDTQELPLSYEVEWSTGDRE